MASVIKRTWLGPGPNGRRVRKVSWGYTLQLGGKQIRRFSEEWTREEAQNALAKRLLQRSAPKEAPKPKTLGAVVDEYLEFKRAKGKRSVHHDEYRLKKVKDWFGVDTPITEVTAQRIAQYDRARVTEPSRRNRSVTPATVNRELSVLRHVLRLCEEWGYIEKVPRIRLAPEPEGRLRFLAEDEILRLLGACERSKNLYLNAIVTIALNTGMRKGEILGLEWERVDFSRGVLLAEKTKSGRRREVPMNRAVYDALSTLTGVREGLVFRKRSGAAWGNIRTAFERACQAAKLEDFRFHDLRHTCASWLIMKGRSLKEVQELLGHREFSMTLRYAHLSPDRLRDAVASLEGLGTGVAQSTPLSPQVSAKTTKLP